LLLLIRRLHVSTFFPYTTLFRSDAFGQGGNMPQIYKSFGIDTAIFWRGVADTTFEDTQFIWEGTDGSKVYSTIMRNGYHFGGERSEEHTSELQSRFDIVCRLLLE